MPIFQLVWILRSKKNPEMFTFISRGCFVCRFHVQNQIFAFYKLLATQKATMLFSRFYSFVNFDVTIQGSFIQKSFGTNMTLFRFFRCHWLCFDCGSLTWFSFDTFSFMYFFHMFLQNFFVWKILYTNWTIDRFMSRSNVQFQMSFWHEYFCGHSVMLVRNYGYKE